MENYQSGEYEFVLDRPEEDLQFFNIRIGFKMKEKGEVTYTKVVLE